MSKYLVIEKKEEVLLWTIPSHQQDNSSLACFHSEGELVSFLEQVNKPIVHQTPNTTSAPENEARNDCIFIKDKDYFRKVSFQNILWVEASGSYCYVHLSNGHNICLSFSLSEVSPRLPSKYFLRIHRSYIINLNQVDAFIGNMICIGEHKLSISRKLREQVINRMNIMGKA
ncbi:MAG: LytTR family transcriptional regulator [Prevotellaceae bacterium]|jgi:DNA-binding LytR/AlgR family response regulator|nr:LytTR family transcriptional regulator [Prevotellaceae bacterium]